MSLYFDTSALAKLVLLEAETTALREWISARRDESQFTNIVGIVELHRLAARVNAAASTAAAYLASRVDQLELTPLALARAATLPPPQVRTLDALHIASASELSDLTALVTYDSRMIIAAREYGLPVDSPGLDAGPPAASA